MYTFRWNRVKFVVRWNCSFQVKLCNLCSSLRGHCYITSDRFKHCKQFTRMIRKKNNGMKMFKAQLKYRCSLSFGNGQCMLSIRLDGCPNKTPVFCEPWSGPINMAHTRHGLLTITVLMWVYIGWQWRNFNSYLCQLVFAAILWVKLSEMFATVISLKYALLASWCS